MPLKPPLLAGALALCASTASLGCATYSDKTEAARSALRSGNYDACLNQYNKLLKVRSAKTLPDKWKKNQELVVLERATVLQAKGEYELSARDFGVADKKLEMLDLAKDGAGKLGKYIYSDSATKYKTTPTEKLSLNALNMVNYLARGDLDGAKVEAKRFTTIRNYFADYDPEHEHGAFGSYLAGFVYERLGRADTALRYYEEALQDRDFASLAQPIARLAAKGSYRGARIKEYLPKEDGRSAAPRPKPEPTSGPATAPAPEPIEAVTPTGATPASGPSLQRPSTPIATVAALPPMHASVWTGAPNTGSTEILVIAKTGRVPYRIPKRIPIGAAIGLAGAYVSGDTTVLEYGMFKVLTYPELTSARNLFVNADLRIDGQAVPMEMATDLGHEVAAEFDEMRPKIIGAALTRMIVRAAAAEGARAAGKQSDSAGGLIGFLAAAAVEGTLVALDKPDTRSWSTLPGIVHVGRLVVPAGAHRVEVTASGPGGQQTRVIELDLPQGGFAVVDVTTLR